MNINMNVSEYELSQNIAQGALTNSKHPDRFVKPFYPLVIEKGMYEYIYDLNGTKWLDFICGLGTNLFGYGNELIENEISKVRRHGQCHSLPTKWEIIASKCVKQMIPWVEKVKFVNDGSSACSAAVTMARAYLKSIGEGYREVVVSEGYHGWHGEFTSLTPPASGITRHKYIEKACYDSEGDIVLGENVGVVIIEPIQLDDSKERIEWLRRLRKQCSEKNIVLIFDETITGFRFEKLTVSKTYNIEPDLLICGKAIANGEKLAFVAGKSCIMDLDYFCSGTYHGHVSALVAFIKCFDLIKNNSQYDIKILIDRGKQFAYDFNSIWKGFIELRGYGPRGSFIASDVIKAMFMQEMAKAHILFGPSFFINYYHVNHLDQILYLNERVAEKFKNGDIVLNGTIPTSPFSAKSRKD